MALVNPNTVPTIDVEVDGDIYTIRTVISGFERDQIKQKAIKMQMTQSKARDVKPDDIVDVYPNNADANLFAKKIFIKSWSHPESLTAANLRLMPAKHDDAVMKKINELMKEQVGEAEDSPLELF